MRRGATSTEIEEIYRRRFRDFVRSMTAFVGDADAALDVVQDGFALALRQRRSFRGDGALEAWVWRVVVNVARDRRRLERRQSNIVIVHPVGEDGAAPETDLRAAVLALPERQRLAIFLRYYAGLSYPQIGEVLGVRPGIVAAALHAAHTKLRRVLEEVPQ